MVVNTRALWLAFCCSLSLAACTAPDGQALNAQSSQSSSSPFKSNNGGGGGSGGY